MKVPSLLQFDGIDTTQRRVVTRSASPASALGLAARGLVALGLTALGFAGCGSDGPTRGGLLVEWRIPIGCQATQVVTVEARAVPLNAGSVLGANGELLGPTPLSDAAACSAGGPFAFAALPAGKYRVEVEGFNADGVGTYFGMAPSVNVRSGQETHTDTIALQQKQSGLDIVWVFQNGKLCTHNGVDHVQIGVFDESAAQFMGEELAAPFPCDPGMAMPIEARTFGVSPEPDYVPEGLLMGSLPPQRTYFVHGVGYNAEGDAVMKAERVVKTQLGVVSEATLVFVPCSSEEAPTVVCQ